MLSRRGAALAALALAVGCARIEPPPGGPPDKKAPTLLAVRPDSLAVLPGFDGDVEFLFDEVISEGSSPSEGFGTGELEKLILLSPTAEVPRVGWKRNRISVRPREGWRPNTVYRVQLLPGVADVRGNRPQGAGGVTLTFTTGAPLPDYALTGKVFDWNTGRPGASALLEAVLQPDSLVYRAATDSTGGFRFGPLPRGRYLVYATVDQNRNGRRDRRESYDSALVAMDTAATGAVPELWMFTRDTTPPRAQQAAVQDSLSFAIQFSQKLDPALVTDTGMVTVLRLPDSARVRVVSFLAPAQHDSLYRRPAVDTAKAKADSAGRRADSLAAPRADTTKAPAQPGQLPPAKAPPAKAPAAKPAPRQAPVPAKPAPQPPPGAKAPLKPATDSARAVIERLDSLLPKGKGRDTTRARPGRPALQDRLVVRLAEPLVPGGRYAVDVRGIRNPSGAAGDSRTGFTVPERPKPKPDSLAPDSLRRPADSLRTRDSLPPGNKAPAPANRDSLPADPRKQAAPKR